MLDAQDANTALCLFVGNISVVYDYFSFMQVKSPPKSRKHLVTSRLFKLTKTLKIIYAFFYTTIEFRNFESI